MSQYHVIETQFKDQGCLVKALKEMGLEAEIYEKGTTLNTTMSQKHPIAHVVVRRNKFGGYGDVGFEKTATGFVLHCDDYDWSENRHKKFNLEKLRIQYNKEVVRKVIGKSSKYTEVSCEQLSDGREKMKLKVWEF